MEDNKTSPAAEVLTEEDKRLLDLFRMLSAEQKDLVLQILAQIKTR